MTSEQVVVDGDEFVKRVVAAVDDDTLFLYGHQAVEVWYDSEIVEEKKASTFRALLVLMLREGLKAL